MTHQGPDRVAGRNAQLREARETHPRGPQDEDPESSKNLKAGGESGEQIICDPAARKKDMGAEEGDGGATFYLSAIFHGSLSKHIIGSSSLILPEGDADLQGSLGGKK